MRIPEYDLDLTITSYFPGQEMDVSVRYWEGAVQIDGTAGGADLSGRGYVELTGYADGASAGPMS
jgi:predicted secreted hydrolase